MPAKKICLIKICLMNKHRLCLIKTCLINMPNENMPNI